MARTMGLPVGPIVLATNANDAIGDYLRSGHYRPRPAIETLATAMDVGDPSNMERFRYLEQHDLLGDGRIDVFSVDDNAISQQIAADFDNYGRVHCPHTATATNAWQRLPNGLRKERPWVLVSTAHAAKFETTVEPLIGRPIELPPSLAEIENRKAQYTIIGPDFAELSEVLSTGDALIAGTD
jgi:threonine synthase